MKRLEGILVASLFAVVVEVGLYIVFFLLLSFITFSFELTWERMKIDFTFVRMIIGSTIMSIAFTDWLVGGIFKK